MSDRHNGEPGFSPLTGNPCVYIDAGLSISVRVGIKNFNKGVGGCGHKCIALCLYSYVFGLARWRRGRGPNSKSVSSVYI